MVITEAELREAWKNGRGSIPEIPSDARLTPAARDFLAAIGSSDALQAQSAAAASLAHEDAGNSMELSSSNGRLILTSADIDEILAKRPQSLIVHPEITITDVARERLRNAGIRIIPFMDKKPAAPVPISHNMTAQPPSAMLAMRARTDKIGPALQNAEQATEPFDEIFAVVKKAVMAKLGEKADEYLVDSVLRRVLSTLK